MAVGFAAGNPPVTIIWRAIVVMVVSWVAGQAVGHIAQRTIEMQVDSYKQVNPFPPLSKMDVDDQEVIVVDSEGEITEPDTKTEAEAA